MLRYFIAFCALCLGGLAAAADFAIAVSQLPPQQRGAPGGPSWEEQLLMFEACVTCYAVAYATGRLLYRWRGAHAEAEELQRWSRQHMVVLNTVCGCLLVASGGQALLQAAVRPSLVIGALLLGMAAYDVWRALREVRAGPADDPQVVHDLPRNSGSLEHASFSRERAVEPGVWRPRVAMLFVWRGWGYFGLGALFIPLASCAGLTDWNPVAAITLSGLTLAAGGLACRHYGQKWNQGSRFHMIYWVPLECWGWVYIVLGGLCGSLGIAALIKKTLVG
jgi:hypothetical protein